MRLAQIERGAVVNVIEVDADAVPKFAEQWPESHDAGPGWIYADGAFFPPEVVEPDIEELRAKMPPVSPLQGRLALGPETCLLIDAIADDPETPWAMRQAIVKATEWRRNSQAMTELGYLLGYTDTEMDDLFRIAINIEV